MTSEFAISGTIDSADRLIISPSIAETNPGE